VIDVVIVQINVYIFDESNNGLASFIFWRNFEDSSPEFS
jgi:hypothetical protein